MGSRERLQVHVREREILAFVRLFFVQLACVSPGCSRSLRCFNCSLPKPSALSIDSLPCELWCGQFFYHRDSPGKAALLGEPAGASSFSARGLRQSTAQIHNQRDERPVSEKSWPQLFS